MMKSLILKIFIVLSFFCAKSNAETPKEGRPTAYLYEVKDKYTQSIGAKERLEKAGFNVQTLPLDKSPADIDAELIMFGSFASESSEYKEYMKKYAKDLIKYIAKGHTLLQMSQADQTETVPPMLPQNHACKRGDRDFNILNIFSEDKLLLNGLQIKNGKINPAAKNIAMEAFESQEGFQIVLCGEESGAYPLLLVGVHGQGRLILCCMTIDKIIENQNGLVIQDEKVNSLSNKFFKNLKEFVIKVKNKTAPAPQISITDSNLKKIIPGSWSLIVLPDTQIYSARLPGLFDAQTAWICKNLEARNIKYVLHLGDITDNNSDHQWGNARSSMKLLDDYKIPYALATGNHDNGPNGSSTSRETKLNKHFDFKKHSSMKTFGGAEEDGKLENTYHLFEAGGKKWIIIALEWAPSDEAVQWANKVMEQHPEHYGILITHAYMNNNDHRYDHTDSKISQQYNPHHYKTPGNKNDGQQLWDKLVKKHKFMFTFNGHVLGDGTGYLKSVTEKGNVCHQILTNYQFRNLGGEAYLKILEFSPDGKTVIVKAYSPLYDKYMTRGDQSYTLEVTE